MASLIEGRIDHGRGDGLDVASLLQRELLLLEQTPGGCRMMEDQMWKGII